MANIINKQIPQLGTWMKWGNGYFYTNHKDMVLEHYNDKYLANNVNPTETKNLKPISENVIQEIKEYKNVVLNNNVYDINFSLLSSKKYANHCITDAYGDRYYDIPIYLLHQLVGDVDVNDYFQVEARKLTFKKRIRLIRLKSNNDCFDIEQILFQNKPNNSNIIPVVEKALDCNEYIQLENIENCFLLFWKCIECHVKSDHWSKLNKHNCKDDESTVTKPKKMIESRNSALRSNGRSVLTTRSQHICPHCSGEFDSEGYLRTHLLVHANDSNKCPFCDQPVAPEMMETHLVAHQNPEFSNLKFLCKYDLILLYHYSMLN